MKTIYTFSLVQVAFCSQMNSISKLKMLLLFKSFWMLVLEILWAVFTTVLLQDAINHFNSHLLDETRTSSYTRRLLYPMFGETCFITKESNLAKRIKSWRGRGGGQGVVGRNPNCTILYSYQSCSLIINLIRQLHLIRWCYFLMKMGK